MTQPLVATRTRGISIKMIKIATYMAEHPEGCTPKMIACGTSLNVNTVKSILPKLQYIETITRGLYKVLNRGDTPISSCGDLPSWNFHNLVLSYDLETYRSMSIEVDFNLVKICMNISDDGKFTARLSTDYPLNVSSICLLYGYICLYMRPYTNDEMSMSKIMVRTIEFNQDHSNLKLDGVQCITLDHLATQFKMYQKSIGLRVEHKTKVNFNVENMVDMLTGSSTAVDLSKRMSEQALQLQKLTGQTVYNTQLLNRLISGMKPC